MRGETLTVAPSSWGIVIPDSHWDDPMIEGVEERDVEAALEKAREYAVRVDQAVAKAPPEMAKAIRRSAHSMVFNLEKALEVLRRENGQNPGKPITYS